MIAAEIRIAHKAEHARQTGRTSFSLSCGDDNERRHLMAALMDLGLGWVSHPWHLRVPLGD